MKKQEMSEQITSRLGRRYLVVLVVIASLVILDAAVLQPTLIRLSLFAPVINVAGRQRMLSQRLTKAALMLAVADTEEARSACRSELEDALQELTRAHEGLQKGSETLRLPVLRNPSIQQGFDDLSPSYQAMTTAAGRVLDATGSEKDLATIIANEGEYLSRMDKIVGMFEADAREQILWLRASGLAVTSIVLALLGILGAKVLRPALKLIESQLTALVASEQRYRLVVECMSDGLAVYQLGGRLDYVNEHLCRLLGRTSDELINRPLASFASPESRPALLKLLARSEHSDWQTVDVSWLHSNGQNVYSQVSIGSVHVTGDTSPTWFTVVTDLTDRKLNEDRLKAAHARLEERVLERTAQLTDANEALETEIEQKEIAQTRTRQLLDQLAHTSRVHATGQLATGLAHEINQPLGAITNYAEGCLLIVETIQNDDESLSKSARSSAEKLATALTLIRKSAMRAGTIIRRMRSFIQRRPRQLLPTDLNELVDEVVALCGPEADQQDIQLTVESGEHPIICEVESIQVQQVLVNLIQNGFRAMKETAQGERLMTITVIQDENIASIRVSDTGPGFPESKGDESFEPFFTTSPDGLGMGLSISQAIISDHGGHLIVGTNSAGGADVTFTLPLSNIDEQPHNSDALEIDAANEGAVL